MIPEGYMFFSGNERQALLFPRTETHRLALKLYDLSLTNCALRVSISQGNDLLWGSGEAPQMVSSAGSHVLEFDRAFRTMIFTLDPVEPEDPHQAAFAYSILR